MQDTGGQGADSKKLKDKGQSQGKLAVALAARLQDMFEIASEERKHLQVQAIGLREEAEQAWADAQTAWSEAQRLERQAVEHRAAAKSEAGQLRSEAEAATTLAHKLKTALSDAESRLEESETRNLKQQEEVAELREQGAKLQLKCDWLKANLQASANRAANATAECKDIRVAHEALRSEYEQLHAAYACRSDEVQQLQADMDSAAQPRIAARNGDVDTAQPTWNKV